MKNELITGNDVKEWLQSDEVLKLTALIYLKEALVAQRYEECAALISEAKDLGAKQSEINALIADVSPTRSGGKERGYGAKLKNKNRF